MNFAAIVCVAAALVVAGVDWWAVSRRNKSLEYVCKPGAAVLFAVAAVLVEPVDGASRTWLVIALVFCLLGDVFLMLPRDAFVPGLASFAVAQVLFTVSFVLRETSAARLLVAIVLVVSGSLVLARRFVGALKSSGHRSLIAPIVVYMIVISAMVVSAVTSGVVLGIVGAILFMASDSLIAEERFVRARPWQPLTIIVTYHLALAGLVLGLV